MTRDCISEEMAKNRIRSQLKNEEIINKCDFIIENNGTESELFEKVSLLAEKLLTLEKRK
jgi:dephospho-CoA kinase